MFTVSPTSKFARECFEELMEDGLPHSFKEITSYVMRQAEERAFPGEFYPGKIWMAITQLVKKEENEYTRIGYGVYQKGIQATTEFESPASNWERALDKSVELEELLRACFSQEAPMPDMTLVETRNFNAISKSSTAGIEMVIEGIAAWLAQMEDHSHALSDEHDRKMSMTM